MVGAIQNGYKPNITSPRSSAVCIQDAHLGNRISQKPNKFYDIIRNDEYIITWNAYLAPDT